MSISVVSGRVTVKCRVSLLPLVLGLDILKPFDFFKNTHMPQCKVILASASNCLPFVVGEKISIALDLASPLCLVRIF